MGTEVSLPSDPTTHHRFAKRREKGNSTQGCRKRKRNHTTTTLPHPSLTLNVE